MQYRNLGRSGLKVSVISLGTNAFGPRADEATAAAVLDQALEAGINLIDTANVYGFGESERMIGKAIAGRRSQFILATKAGLPFGDGPNQGGTSRQHLLDSIDASLKRLGTDYVDLYQLHRWDPNTPLEETLQTLDDLVRWGKVRYVGCSNFAAWQMVKALGLQERNGWSRFISSQPEYSPANRKIERELVPAGISEGVGHLVYFPLAGGLFTGKYKRNEAPPEGSRATKAPQFTDRWLTERNFALMERMTDLASEAGMPLPHLALAWAIAKPGVTSAIVGATRPEQVAANAAAGDITLSPEIVAKVDEISAEFM